MKKRIMTLLAAILLLTVAAGACAQAYPVVTDAFEWEVVRLPSGVSFKGDFREQTFTDGWMLVDTDDGEGYLNTQNQLVNKKSAPWSNAAQPSEGYAYVQENGMPLMVNLNWQSFFRAHFKYNGKKYHYNKIGPCLDGMIRVEIPCTVDGYNVTSVGYLNAGGETIADALNPRWGMGSDFQNGHARVCDYDGRWHIIDKQGKAVASLPEDAMPMAMLSDTYVYRVGMEYTLASYESGDICRLGTFTNCTADNGLYFAEANELENNKVFDQTGRVVADRTMLLDMGVTAGNGAPYLPIIRGLDNGLIMFRGCYGDSSGFGYLDADGQMVLEPGTYAARHQNWLIPYESDEGLWGLMDVEGNVAVEPQFMGIGKVGDGACLVSVDGWIQLLRFYWDGNPGQRY